VGTERVKGNRGLRERHTQRQRERQREKERERERERESMCERADKGWREIVERGMDRERK
jgi:hypothetical protein